MLALIGKTGTGKDAIKNELLKLGMENVVTSTTRPIRNNEVKDVSYHFLTKEEFLSKKNKNEFAETTSYDTVYSRWYYGTQLNDLENNENKVIIVNPHGIKSLANICNIDNWIIFHIVCSKDIVRNRLLNRGDSTEEVNRRFETDDRDFVNIRRFIDYEIINNGDKTPRDIAIMIKKIYERSIKNYE